jgi:hypothetical protein
MLRLYPHGSTIPTELLDLWPFLIDLTDKRDVRGVLGAELWTLVLFIREAGHFE